jgi:hypothetical protein
MANTTTTALDILTANHTVHQRSGIRVIDSEGRRNYSRSLTTRQVEHLDTCSAQHLDEYTVDHGLSPKQLRILLKIMAKELLDCGRKRGAILRYIAQYEKTIPSVGNERLYQVLRSLDQEK